MGVGNESNTMVTGNMEWGMWKVEDERWRMDWGTWSYHPHPTNQTFPA